MAELIWTVEDYLQTAPEAQQATLKQLRVFCGSLLPGFDERLHLGVPAYFRHGAAEVAFTGGQNGISFCVFSRQVAERFPRELDASGCLRYADPAAVDFLLVERILQAIAEPFDFQIDFQR